MKNKWFAAISVVLCCICFLAISSPVHAQGSPGKAMFKIVGGDKAPDGAWPWMAALVNGPDNFNDQYCGAALIEPKWVLTAAHCVQLSDSVQSFQVLIGLDNLADTGTRHNVKAAHIHPDYYNSDGMVVPDIALLELETAASETPIRLYRGGATLEGVDATIIGWGATVADGTGSPYDLMQAQVPIVSNQTCNSVHGGIITDWELCAGYSAGGIDSCSGDSGGPLMIYEDGAWKMAGITSWGDGCARANSYGVYTRITPLLGWIDNIMHPRIGDYNADGAVGLADSIAILQVLAGIRNP